MSKTDWQAWFAGLRLPLYVELPGYGKVEKHQAAKAIGVHLSRAEARYRTGWSAAACFGLQSPPNFRIQPGGRIRWQNRYYTDPGAWISVYRPDMTEKQFRSLFRRGLGLNGIFRYTPEASDNVDKEWSR